MQRADLFEKPLNLDLKPGADYFEVKDTIFDVLRIGVILENELSDGFQISDIIPLIDTRAIIKEVIDDVPEFLNQFSQLTGENAIKATMEAKEELMNIAKMGPISTKIANILLRSANSYKFAAATYQAAENEVNMWKDLFASEK